MSKETNGERDVSERIHTLDRRQRRTIVFLKEKDKRLGKLIESVNKKLGPRNQLIGTDPRPLLEALIRAVVGQQLSGGAARTIFRRLKMLLDEKEITARGILGLPLEKLSKVGLSTMKARYIKNVAKAIEDGVLDLERLKKESDQNVLESLQAIKGIGRWTAEMYLIFHLQRPDVLPSNDLGIRRGVQIAYRMKEKPSSEEVDKIGLKWKPYRTLASRYLWEAVNMKM